MQHNVYEKLYQGLPAQLLEFQIVDFRDGPNIEDNKLSQILDFFSTGGNPVVRTIDLKDIENEESLLIEEELKETDKGKDSGVTTAEPFENDADALSNTVESRRETVRFQYDGLLKMEVTTNSTYDKLTCNSPPLVPLTDKKIGQSFHVIDYMALFFVRVDLEYEIIPQSEGTSGVFCDIVDEKTHQIEITNNVGMDDVAGFEAFYNNLGQTVKDALAICSTVAPPGGGSPAQGPCLQAITHNDDGENAGLDFSFAAGRPNPFGSYTKNIIFKAISAQSTVQHNAEFFIEGLYSKGIGNSFALPTHEPIMVLRDPPGM